MEPKDLEAEGGGEEVRGKSWMEIEIEHRVAMIEVKKFITCSIRDRAAS